MLEEDELGLWLLRRGSILMDPVSHDVTEDIESIKMEMIPTRIFFNATNTLGAETTAIVISAVAPSSSSLANKPAVSSEYYLPNPHSHQHPCLLS